MVLAGILSRRGEYIQLVEVFPFSHQKLCVGFYFSVLNEGKDWRTAIGETLLGIGIQDLLASTDALINVGLTIRNKTSWLRLLVLIRGSWWNHGNSVMMALKREDGATFRRRCIFTFRLNLQMLL